MSYGSAPLPASSFRLARAPPQPTAPAPAPAPGPSTSTSTNTSASPHAFDVVNYFAYGADMHMTYMANAYPSSKFLGRAVLADFRWNVNVLGHADLVPSLRAHVAGLVFEMGVDDFARLNAAKYPRFMMSTFTVQLTPAPNRLYRRPAAWLAREVETTTTTTTTTGGRNDERLPVSCTVRVLRSDLAAADARPDRAYAERLWQGAKDALALGVDLSYFQRTWAPVFPGRTLPHLTIVHRTRTPTPAQARVEGRPREEQRRWTAERPSAERSKREAPKTRGASAERRPASLAITAQPPPVTGASNNRAHGRSVSEAGAVSNAGATNTNANGDAGGDNGALLRTTDLPAVVIRGGPVDKDAPTTPEFGPAGHEEKGEEDDDDDDDDDNVDDVDGGGYSDSDSDSDDSLPRPSARYLEFLQRAKNDPCFAGRSWLPKDEAAEPARTNGVKLPLVNGVTGAAKYLDFLQRAKNEPCFAGRAWLPKDEAAEPTRTNGVTLQVNGVTAAGDALEG